MKFCIQCAAVAFALVVGLIIGFFFLAPEVQIVWLGALERGWVALIGNAGPVSAAVIAFCTFVYQIWTKHEATKGRGEVKAAVQEVATVAAVRQEEIQMAHVAGKREGFVGGIEEGKKRATNPAPLAVDFDPAATDLGARK